MSAIVSPVNTTTMLLPETVLLKLETFITALDEFKTVTALIRSNISLHNGLHKQTDMSDHVEQCSSYIEEIIAIRELAQLACAQNREWELHEKAKLIGLRISLIRHTVELQDTVKQFNNILSGCAT